MFLMIVPKMVTVLSICIQTYKAVSKQISTGNLNCDRD